MIYPVTEVHFGSNWTAIYVVLGAIPVVFVIVAVYSTWRERMTKRQRDLEESEKQSAMSTSSHRPRFNSASADSVLSPRASGSGE
jgi:uncharacterized membrane protein